MWSFKHKCKREIVNIDYEEVGGKKYTLALHRCSKCATCDVVTVKGTWKLEDFQAKLP